MDPSVQVCFYLNSQQKGERQSGFPCSCSSSNPADTDLVTDGRDGTSGGVSGSSPVDVRPDKLRRVVIHNALDAADVDSSGRRVRADQPTGRKIRRSRMRKVRF